MPGTLEEATAGIREIPVRRREPVEASDAAEPANPRRRVELHVGTTRAEKRLLKTGYLILALMSALLGVASLAYTFADIYWSLTGPVELRAEFQGLALMGVLTCSLAWAGTAAIGRLLLEPPEDGPRRS